jgi:CRISPR/Cas system endoribonuclease Cas6 (RAMP superfamily)
LPGWRSGLSVFGKNNPSIEELHQKWSYQGEKIIAYLDSSHNAARLHRKTKKNWGLLLINIFQTGMKRNASKTEPNKKPNNFKFFFLVGMQKVLQAEMQKPNTKADKQSSISSGQQGNIRVVIHGMTEQGNIRDYNENEGL